MKKVKFWAFDEKGLVKINQSKLTVFLTDSGYSKSKKQDGVIMLVKENGNVVSEVYDTDIIDFINDYLKKINEEDVLEAFSKGVSTYLSPAKLKLLNTISLLNDRDSKDFSFFHFKNKSCQVGNGQVLSTLFEDLPNKIWDKRILKNDFGFFDMSNKSQFETFCNNLSGNNSDRFLALQTIIGYALHRYQDPKNAKAIILVDENISFDGEANGGTGKTLLVKGIEHCREVIVMDGKSLKTKSWFKNQRIDYTTDLVFYDDVNKDFTLEELYSMITTGIVVEKKYKGELYIKPEDAPKIIISSNYIVKGTGGNTDTRRRCDFEVANYYNADKTPFDEFGNRFFEDWYTTEWSAFYSFMMNCVLQYFQHGLITAEPINLKKNGLINSTSLEFVSFMGTGVVEFEEWISKKTVLDLFIGEYPHYRNLSSHQFTKWIKIFAKKNELVYEDRKSGVKYEFYLKSLEKSEEGTDE
jgi:hypothetical protein